MESAYNEIHAKELIRHYPNIAEELVLRTYTSRLLGANPNLMFHGGGNTSIKLIQKNILQEDQEILFVRGVHKTENTRENSDNAARKCCNS